VVREGSLGVLAKESEANTSSGRSPDCRTSLARSTRAVTAAAG